MLYCGVKSLKCPMRENGQERDKKTYLIINEIFSAVFDI